MKQKKCVRNCVCCCCISAWLLVSGSVLLFLWPSLFKHLVESNLVLTKDSYAFHIWRKFPQTFPMDFYFFNWTNPQDVYNPAVKPRFREVGPYRYLESKEKADIVWNDNGTVSFKHLRHWFVDGKSKHDVSDLITTLNPVAISASYTSRFWSYLMRKGLSLSLTSMAPTVHLTRTIKQMLFEGYPDPMISIARKLPFLAGRSLPAWDRFGWFYGRNGSADYEGTFNMGTGINSIFGRLYRWNSWTQTPYFEGHCANVSGSDGEFFPKPDQTSISFFSSDLCRTLTLRFSGFSTVHNILGYKFVLDDYMLDNGTTFPRNKCFCSGDCVPSGLMNVSSCRYGSPSFASLPHFYNADPYYVDSVEGLKPDKDKHEFFLTLEPTTGIPLEVSARLQLNLLLQPVPGLALYENVPKVFVPMLWFEQAVKIPEHESYLLRLLLNLPVICISLGVVLVVVSIIIMSCVVYKMCTTQLCHLKKDKTVLAEQQIPLQGKKARKL